MVETGTAPQAAMVRKETIGNTIATAVIAAILTWAIFRGQSAIPVWVKAPGGIFGILPGTFNFTLLVTIALTLITRRRVTKGLYGRVAPQDGNQRGRSLPSNVLLRGVVLGFVATLIFVPIAAGAVWLATRAGLLPAVWSFEGMLAFFVMYFVALSWIVTPVVIWSALRD